MHKDGVLKRGEVICMISTNSIVNTVSKGGWGGGAGKGEKGRGGGGENSNNNAFQRGKLGGWRETGGIV